MIIENMSIEEMQKEAQRDIDPLYVKMGYLFIENRRFFIKSKKFPVCKTFKWNSRITQIEWDIIFLARDKKEQTSPKVVPYITFQSYGVGVLYVRR